MIRDHTAVNTAALDLLAKLDAQAQDNFLSQTLNANAEVKALFEQGMEIFKVHEGHAGNMVQALR